MILSKLLTTVVCVLMLCVLTPMSAVADQAQYIYDDLGRLSQVIDGFGNVAVSCEWGSLSTHYQRTGGDYAASSELCPA